MTKTICVLLCCMVISEKVVIERNHITFHFKSHMSFFSGVVMSVRVATPSKR